MHARRDELAFHIYNGKTTAPTSRWQRLLCGTVWALHCFKLLILALHMTQARCAEFFVVYCRAAPLQTADPRAAHDAGQVR